MVDFFAETASKFLRPEEWAHPDSIVDWFQRLPPAAQAYAVQSRYHAITYALDAAYVLRLARNPGSIVPERPNFLQKAWLKATCWFDEADLDYQMRRRHLIPRRPRAEARLRGLDSLAAPMDSAPWARPSPTDSSGLVPSTSATSSTSTSSAGARRVSDSDEVSADAVVLSKTPAAGAGARFTEGRPSAARCAPMKADARTPLLGAHRSGGGIVEV